MRELEVREGPVEVRRWYVLRWWPGRPDREGQADWQASANPWVSADEQRDFDGNEKHAEHQWIDQSNIRASQMLLIVGGWDLSLVKKVYSEQRAQYLARKEGVS